MRRRGQARTGRSGYVDAIGAHRPAAGWKFQTHPWSMYKTHLLAPKQSQKGLITESLSLCNTPYSTENCSIILTSVDAGKNVPKGPKNIVSLKPPAVVLPPGYYACRVRDRRMNPPSPSSTFPPWLYPSIPAPRPLHEPSLYVAQEGLYFGRGELAFRYLPRKFMRISFHRFVVFARLLRITRNSPLSVPAILPKCTPTPHLEGGDPLLLVDCWRSRMSKRQVV